MSIFFLCNSQGDSLQTNLAIVREKKIYIQVGGYEEMMTSCLRWVQEMMTSADKVGGWVKKGQNHDDVILEWSLTEFVLLIKTTPFYEVN